MSTGEAAFAPPVGAKVFHPLYPELGVGVVEAANTDTLPSLRTGRIRWECGQVSRHALCVLREVDQ